MTRPIVIKVGGSLLDWPGLPNSLAIYLEHRKADRLVLIVGGGHFANVLRDLDASHALGERRSHALALRVLDFTSHVLASLVPGLEVVEGWTEFEATWARGVVPVLAPRRFLEEDDRSADPLPHAWTTTTDSIAARLAVRIGAGELTLLKSTPLPPGLARLGATRLGLVDPEFLKASDDVPIVIYRNFRDDPQSDGMSSPIPFAL